MIKKRKPGDRKRVWKQTCEIEAVIFTALGGLAIYGIEGNAKWIVAAFFGLMVFLAIRDHRRGWKIRYDIPPWGKRAIERGDPVAIEAARETREAAKNPNRKRYAFDDGE